MHALARDQGAQITSVPVPTFVILPGTRAYERRNQRDTSNLFDASVALDLTFQRTTCGNAGRNVKSATLAANRTSVARDYAMTAGGLVAGTELVGLLTGSKWPHHGSIEYPFAAQICPLDDRCPSAELTWKLCLQAAERRSCFGLGLLRGELHQKA